MNDETPKPPSMIEPHTHTHTTVGSEQYPPHLTKGNLLHTSIDGTTVIFDGIFQDNPVIIKETNDPHTIPMIQKEHDFLLSPPIDPINATLQDYGIPSDWRVQTRFVKLMDKAVTHEMYKRGVTVLEKAQGEALQDSATHATNHKIPFKFHFGAFMGYLDMMRQLAKMNVALDSNIDTDLFIMPDVSNRRLNVVRIDCMPSAGGASEASLLQTPNSENWRRLRKDGRLNNEQLTVDQVIGIANGLYPHRSPTWKFLGSTIPALRGRFTEADIHNAESLFDRLKSGLSRANWQDNFIQEADNHRLQKWPGGQFT